MYLKIKYLFFLFLLFISVSSAQSNKSERQYEETPGKIFNKIEEGFSLGDPEKFSKYLDAQTYASLSDGITGYYSSNQFYYILQNYFYIYKPISFRFINQNNEGENPYASGYYKFESKGIRGTAQVFISLKRFGTNWKISQVTIK